MPLPFTLVFLLSGACVSSRPPAGEPLLAALRPLCGKAFEGRLVEGTAPGDAAIGKERLVMHVRSCSADEIRIPFHVGGNRSRTWIVSRTAGGLRLKHDHRHEDGAPDAITMYGGDSRPADGGSSLFTPHSSPLPSNAVDFFADAHTASMIPAAATNIWTIAVVPGRTFTYALRREAEGGGSGSNSI